MKQEDIEKNWPLELVGMRAKNILDESQYLDPIINPSRQPTAKRKTILLLGAGLMSISGVLSKHLASANIAVVFQSAFESADGLSEAFNKLSKEMDIIALDYKHDLLDIVQRMSANDISIGEAIQERQEFKLSAVENYPLPVIERKTKDWQTPSWMQHRNKKRGKRK